MRTGWIAVAFVAGVVLGAVGVTAIQNPWRGPATLLNYEAASDGREILVLVGMGRLDSINFVDGQEDANAVRINVDLIHFRGLVPADMKVVYVPVQLERPLGSRDVLDAAGRSVPLRRR